ncbi:Sulfate permease [hydrothermal vent metagenome]|uniref:Sulfate permease n=1 Tax=hydrothermal vent metagenome TaxID=652676 RepID=A0A3B1CIJ8_9ZZZZ
MEDKTGKSRFVLWLGGLRFNMAEASGALGDLGLFIPLTVALVTVCGMDGGSILLFAGLFNLVTGLMFNQPVPVQPMKAIAAVAIAEGLAPGEIAAAGFLAGAIVLLLGLTGLIQKIEKLVPRPVVRGIQLGVGLKLAVKGVALIMATQWIAWDGRIIAIIAAIMILAMSHREKFPSALILFIAGFGLMFINSPQVFHGLTMGWSWPGFIMPSSDQWVDGFFLGTLPQIPLTLLNSVIAICALSADLYPGKGIKTRSMALSVGAMNVFACLLGAAPMCHGSGGLAGQHRFGARTGGSVVILGAAKVIVGLFFGTATIAILAAYPVSILGALLIFSGLELTLPARDCVKRNAFLTATATACGILAANTAVGFILGLITALFIQQKRTIIHPD